MGKLLYLGTDPCFNLEDKEVIYYPVIRIAPRDLKLKDLSNITHHIITSKNTVEVLFSLDKDIGRHLQGKCFSIGPATTEALKRRGVELFLEAKVCSQEGIIEEMKRYNWKDAYIFYPRSSLARPLLVEYLQREQIAHEVVDLYDTVYQMPYWIESFTEIEEIIFTSPSTVEGFFRIYGNFPVGVRWKLQGPVTEAAFWEKMRHCNY